MNKAQYNWTLRILLHEVEEIKKGVEELERNRKRLGKLTKGDRNGR